MPAYHSAYNDADVGAIASMSLLPIRTRVRGPAPPLADADAMDIVDEAIDLFRANCLFRNFEIKGGADRVSGSVEAAGSVNAAWTRSPEKVGWAR